MCLDLQSFNVLGFKGRTIAWVVSNDVNDLSRYKNIISDE